METLIITLIAIIAVAAAIVNGINNGRKLEKNKNNFVVISESVFIEN